MTAPDPGLTDLIAAALVRSSPNSIDTFDLLPYHRQEAWRVRAREVALVVEQHTNGRITELEAELAEAKDDKFYARVELNADMQWKARAEQAEATIARVRAVEADYLDPEDADIECREDVWRFIRDLRAALEGEQQ